ncbi:hypothetical protein MIND_00640600 [Mycena indigotica]|uniref:Zn(2)-C6 fungal-type domain-containing protein n=1 Tax=Mycena indigotica TaxID=2126181 RepID=A0A8H6SSW4_9AGAR|nr:uncharacterized protein MIND_00640600 [Mycena indigotica]KAF7304091.1 hypothetical protein MIND_00640600 [Mycena indigotica]
MASDSNKASAVRPLRRGKACFNCRHLKIKCDGERPMCGPCIRVPKDDPCEYADTMSRTQELQDTVHRLQSRIDELQAQTGTAGPSRLFSPYPSHSSMRGSPFSEHSAGSHRSYMSDDAPDFDEPPFPMIQLLIQSFLPHALQFGFFLDIQRFHDAALLPLPMGDPLRPSPALLCVVYLWGVRLSQLQPLLASEPTFLRRAQQHISTAISSVLESSSTVIYTIQAQILLSTYLFRVNRLLEAEVHVNGAATLALRYGLHRIRSSRAHSPSLSAQLSLSMTQSTDAVHEGERIRGFWALASLQSHICVTQNGSSTSAAFCVLEGPAADIDTPWPLEITDYANGGLHSGYRGQESIRHLMTDDTFNAGSPVSLLLAKASVLMYRATRLAATKLSNLSPQQTTSHLAACSLLDRRLTQFWQSLPPIYTVYSDGSSARCLAMTHALTAGAVLKVHSSSSRSTATRGASVNTSHQRTLFAARTILEALGDIRIPDRAIAHPVVGSLGFFACKTLIEEFQRVRTSDWSIRTPTTAHHGQHYNSEVTALMVEVNAGLATMQVYAADSPLVDHQLQQLRRDYDGL